MGWAEDPSQRAAEAALAAGRTEEAREAFREIRRADPRAWPAWWGEVRSTRDPERSRRLVAEVQGLVDSSTRSTDRACFMALRATLSNDDATRRAGLDAALELDPECGLAHFLRGEVLRARGESGPAFQSYLRAVNQTSAPPQAWPGLAETAMADHRPHIAQRALEVCARLEPGNARWHYNLGTVLLETDDNPKAARAAFERADALAPGDRDTLMNLATACVRAGDPEAARAVLERAQQLHPDDSDLVFNLAVLHVDHLNDPAGALELFRRYETMTGERSLRVERWIRELEARLQP